MLAKYRLWVFLLIVPLYLCALGNHGLFEDSEARYADIAWEMTSCGDWVTPRFNYIKHFDKPPLTYWMAAASLRVFGHGEFAVRFPVAVTALVGLLLTYYLGCRMLDPLAAFCGTVVLGTSMLYWGLGNTLLTDMFLSVSILAALLCAWQVWHVEDRDRGHWRLGFWLLLAAGFMIKGPVALLVPALVILPYTYVRPLSANIGAGSPIRGEHPSVLSLWNALYALLAGGLGVVWYAVVVKQNPGLLHFFLVFQTFDRVATTVHHRAGPVWFYVPVLLGGFFPWTGLLVPAMRRLVLTVQDGGAEAVKGVGTALGSDAALFLMLWCMLPFAFFSCIGSKLPQYILPVWPAAALAVGVVAAEAWRGFSDRWVLVGAWCTALLLVGLGVVGLVYVSHGVHQRLAAATLDLMVAAALFAAAGSVAVFLSLRRRMAAMLVLLFVTAWSWLAIACHGLGKADDYYSARTVSAAVRRHQTAGVAVAMWGDFLSGLPFYLQQRIIHVGYPRVVQFERKELDNEISYGRRLAKPFVYSDNDLSSNYYAEGADFAPRLQSSEPLLVIVKKERVEQCAPLRTLEVCGDYAILGR